MDLPDADNSFVTQTNDVIYPISNVTPHHHFTATGRSDLVGNGTLSTTVGSEPVSMHEKSEDFMKMDYDEFYGISLGTDQWLNYSCQIGLELPRGFLVDVLEPATCVSGIVGIILTMIVLSRKNMLTSTNCYLTALAVADLLYLVILSTLIVADKIEDCSFQLSSEKTIFSHYTIIFMDIFYYSTIWVTVMLAVERYIAICQPMQAMTICSVKRARVIIVIIFICITILRIPKFFDMEIGYMETKSGEKLIMAKWVFPYNEQVYVCLVQGVLITVLPLCCLLALNIRLIIEIRRSTKYLQVCLGADWQIRSVVTREELKITVMLISVVMAFFICQAPYIIYDLILNLNRYDVFKAPMLTNDASLKVVKHVVRSLVALKSSCNFILYCWFSEKFWTTFKRLFCLRHCLPRQGTHQVNGCSNNNSHNNSNNLHHRPSCYITRETTC